jgi:hypothetical protein
MVTPPCIICLNRDFIVALRGGNVYLRLERRMEAAKTRYPGPSSHPFDRAGSGDGMDEVFRRRPELVVAWALHG